MQLIDTHVGTVTGGTMTVEFQGEGGELISVKMAAEGLEADAAVMRARALMVQLTAFADGRDPSQDNSENSQDEKEDDTGDRTEGLPETKSSDLPAVGSFGDAPPSPSTAS